MASNYRIVVTVDPSRAVRGAQKTSKSLDRTSAAANRLRSAMQGAFVIAGIVAATTALINLADQYTNMQNRLKLVTTDTANLATVTNELFEVANRTRTSYQGTAELFARVSLSVKELGVSQQETLDFTESLNQAVILSGTTAREAHAGIIQLSQGLASGALRGDELRSTLEQLPMVADVIAKEMKVTRGELRLMGEQGKITAEIVLKAFKSARVELAEKFANTTATVSQAWTVFMNQMLRSVGAFNEATGASKALAQIIIFLGAHMNVIIPILGALAVLIGVKLATIAIPALIGAVKTLTVALLFNPFGAFVAFVIAALAVLSQFPEEFTIIKDAIFTVLGNLYDAFKFWFDKIVEFLKWVVSLVSSLMDLMVSDATRAANEVKRQAKIAAQAAAQAQQKAELAEKAAKRARAANAAAGAASAQAAGSRTSAASTSGSRNPNGSTSTFTSDGDIFSGSSFSSANDRGLRGTTNQDLNTYQDLSRNSGNVSNSNMSSATGNRSNFIGGEEGGSRTTFFANGGRIRVGGNAGIDQNKLSINDRKVGMVGRGETIEISPNKKPSSKEVKSGGNNITVNMNISTPDADSFQRSRRQIEAKSFAAQARASNSIN